MVTQIQGIQYYNTYLFPNKVPGLACQRYEKKLIISLFFFLFPLPKIKDGDSTLGFSNILSILKMIHN
jgi:hypothetical protein